VTVLAMAAAAVMAAVLLRAASEKIRRPGELAATIGRLGVPERMALPAALLVIFTELAVAVLLPFRPDSLLAPLGVVSLAALFALAGVLALRSDEPIACSCFGAGSGQLGLRQGLWFFAWAGGAALLFMVRPVVSTVTGAALLAATALAITALRAIGLRAAMTEGRGDRQAAQEMYEWLPSY
jgi:hypothetical protein